MENFSMDSLLDLIKNRHGLPSDYKLGLFLGVVNGSIRNYRHGRSYPDERVCQKLAAAAGIDADVLIAQVQAARCRNSETKSVWERIALRLQTAAATAAVSGLFFFSPLSQDPHGALAGELSPSLKIQPSNLYIVLNSRQVEMSFPSAGASFPTKYKRIHIED